ncbi:MAG: hypothetical protein IPI49_12060 [Myxococcales bacterium]|nr:hypothetical protein [Myxococcales bacterium]
MDDQVVLGVDQQLTAAMDLHHLVGRVEDDLVLLRLVDDDDALGAVLVVEDHPVPGPGLDELGVVLASRVVLDGFLLLVPHRADHDRTIDVAVLEHHQNLIIELRQKVGPALGAGHGRRDSRPERLLVVLEPGELDLDAKARIALAILVVDDDRQMNATQLAGAMRLCHGICDSDEGHGLSVSDRSLVA